MPANYSEIAMVCGPLPDVIATSLTNANFPDDIVTIDIPDGWEIIGPCVYAGIQHDAEYYYPFDSTRLYMITIGKLPGPPTIEEEVP